MGEESTKKIRVNLFDIINTDSDSYEDVTIKETDTQDVPNKEIDTQRNTTDKTKKDWIIVFKFILSFFFIKVE